jgi:hypothetical protein
MNMESTDSSVQETASRPGRTRRYLFDDEAPVFRRAFDRESFEFAHRLAGHPLFEIPALIALAQKTVRHPDGGVRAVYLDAGDAEINQRWSDLDHPDVPPEEVLERIHTANAWILIRRAELVEEYRVMLDECLAEVQEFLQLDLDAVMSVKNALVFVSSPGRTTPYHIDRECNFLLQVSGEKRISIFDKNDRTVLPEQEIETYWAVDNNAARYKPELQDRAHVYHLTPGRAVHIPVNAPHWVKNGGAPSVSLSINFQFRARTCTDVYRTNYYLRRLGLAPTPPGRSELKDSVKRRLLPAFEAAYAWAGRHKNLKDRIARIRGTKGSAVSNRQESNPGPG